LFQLRQARFFLSSKATSTGGTTEEQQVLNTPREQTTVSGVKPYAKLSIGQQRAIGYRYLDAMAGALFTVDLGESEEGGAQEDELSLLGRAESWRSEEYNKFLQDIGVKDVSDCLCVC
jgi:hypothetical protein